MIVSGLARLTGARFIVGPNSELVDHLFLQTFDLCLWSGVGRFRHFHPVDSEFVLHLHGVMSDRSTAVVLRLLPLQGYADVIVVEDYRFARLVRLVWLKKRAK